MDYYEISKLGLCRICFEKKPKMFSLFETPPHKSNFMPFESLLKFTKIKININDKGPSSLCENCLNSLILTKEFLEKCEQSNELLISLMTTIDEKYSEPKPEYITVELNCLESRGIEVEDVIVSQLQSGNVTKSELNDESVELDKDCPRSNIKHNQVLPTDSVIKYECDRCTRAFNKKANLLLHLKRHSGIKDHPCPQCGILQFTKWLAHGHCKPKHRYMCPIPDCDKSFTANSNLQRHIRKHNGQRPFPCLYCNKFFGCKSSLVEHTKIHTGEKPYVCPVCGKQFTTNKLSTHMRIHTGVKPHRCVVAGCGRAFVTRRALTSHAETHAPRERRHRCTHCPARYNHAQSLNKHVKKHHSDNAL